MSGTAVRNLTFVSYSFQENWDVKVLAMYRWPDGLSVGQLTVQLNSCYVLAMLGWPDGWLTCPVA